MRISVAILFFVVSMVAFNSCEQKYRLTLKDLKFPQPEREAIVRNKICAISGFDTVRRFPTLQPLTWAQRTSNISLDSLLSLGFEESRYDSAGNRVYYHKSSGSWCAVITNTNFMFNSYGLMTRSISCSSPDDSFYYVFNSENNLLFSIRYISYENHVFIDTMKVSSFDNSGKLIFEAEPSDNQIKQYFDTTYYTYGQEGKLLVKKTKTAILPDFEYDFSGGVREITTSYFYRGKNLDSVVIDYSFGIDKYNYMNKYFYDDDGLVYKSIFDDYYNDERVKKLAMRNLFYRYKKF